ncbi:MAG: hypothetical protein U9Q66_02365 [Patescibacteria group bacterium]|nr:hypothetical protein [Patescibacteria group bacterium]
MFFEENNDIKAIDNARKTMKETMKYIDYPQVDSEATKKVKEDVARKFGQII